MAQHKCRILFIAESVTLAHVARPYALASSLDRERYDVSFACDSKYAALMDFSGMNKYHLASISGERFLAALATGRPAYDTETLRCYVRDDLNLLKCVAPDLVVGDFRLSLAVSARLEKIPYANIINSYWSPFAKIRYPIPDHFLVRMVGLRAAQFIFDAVRPIIFALHTGPFNRLMRENGLGDFGHSLQRVYSQGDYTFYADYPGFVEMDQLPNNHVFLGPILWSPTISLPKWWGRIPHDKPIVYVTLGSSGSTHLLKIVLKALSELPITVIASTAGEPVSNETYQNAYLAEYLPGDQCIALSKLVVCNGGSPTCQQSLAAGVPVIGIASNLDQHLNMEAVQSKGAGQLLRAEYASPENISKLVREMLISDKYNRAASSFVTLFQEFNGRNAFAQFIMHLV